MQILFSIVQMDVINGSDMPNFKRFPLFCVILNGEIRDAEMDWLFGWKSIFFCCGVFVWFFCRVEDWLIEIYRLTIC